MEAKVQNFVKWLKNHSSQKKTKGQCDPKNVTATPIKYPETITQNEKGFFVTLQTRPGGGQNICRASMKLPPLPREVRRQRETVARPRFLYSPAHVYEEIPDSAVLDELALARMKNNTDHAKQENTPLGYFVVPVEGPDRSHKNVLIPVTADIHDVRCRARPVLADVIPDQAITRQVHNDVSSPHLVRHVNTSASCSQRMDTCRGSGRKDIPTIAVHCTRCSHHNHPPCHCRHEPRQACSHDNAHPEEKYHPGNVSVDSGFCSNRSSRTKLTRTEKQAKQNDQNCAAKRQVKDVAEDEGVVMTEQPRSEPKPADQPKTATTKTPTKRVFVKTPYPRDVYTDSSVYADDVISGEKASCASHSSGSNDTYSEYDLNSGDSFACDECSEDCEYDYYLLKAKQHLKHEEDVKKFIRESESSDTDTPTNTRRDLTPRDDISLTTVTSLSDVSVSCHEIEGDFDSLLKACLERAHRAKKVADKTKLEESMKEKKQQLRHARHGGSDDPDSLIGSSNSAFKKVPSSRSLKRSSGMKSESKSSSRSNGAKEKRKTHSRKHHHHTHSEKHSSRAKAELYEIPDFDHLPQLPTGDADRQTTVTPSGTLEINEKLSCRATNYNPPNCVLVKSLKKRSRSVEDSQNTAPSIVQEGSDDANGSPAHNKLLSDLMKLNHDRQLLMLY